MQIEELNKHCSISFALRAYAKGDEDFRMKKVTCSCKAQTFCFSKEVLLKGFVEIVVV